MEKEYTIEDYIKDNPKDAHIKLYVHLLVISDKEKLAAMPDDTVFNFDLGEIRYSISLGDLKDKVRLESKQYDNGESDI